MTRITLNATTAAQLKDLQEMVELRDESGNVVGHFLPGPPRDVHGKIIVPHSEEELDRRSREHGGRSLHEILIDLEKL
jgi:hypothetical protein